MLILKVPSVSMQTPLGRIYIYPGEAFTVYLKGEDNQVAVELHVTPEGIINILLQEEHKKYIHTFSEIYE